MHYLNQHSGWIGKLLPDMYDALTIDDFLENRDNIPIPSKVRLINPIYYFKTRGVYVLIDFWNVSVRHSYQGFPGTGFFIYDLSNELDILPNALPWEIEKQTKIASLAEGRYSRIRTYYSLRTGNLFFMSSIKNGPPMPTWTNGKDKKSGLEKLATDTA